MSNGLPPYDPTTLYGIETLEFKVTNPVADVSNPLAGEIKFQLGGTNIEPVYTDNPTLTFTIEIFYESIGKLSSGTFEDEGSWGTITGTISEGVAAHGGTELYVYTKTVNLPAPVDMEPGAYKLAMIVTTGHVPSVGEFYSYLEGPIIRRKA